MKCYGYKRVHVRHYPESSTGLLPVDRTSQILAFKMTGIVYTDPLICKLKRAKKNEQIYQSHTS